MQNSQLGLRTVAHNIANRSTEGYSRQRVDFVHSQPVGSQGKRVGTGAQVSALESVRNDYLEKQIEKETQKLGMHQSEADGMARIEQIYNEQQNKGLNRFVSEFFNAFRELANSPESLPIRTLVKEKAVALSEDFGRIHNQLRDVQKDLDYQIKTEVEEINAMTQEIAALNEEISMVELQDQTANDERDRRNLLLKKLGEKVNIKYAENDEGIVTVMMGSTGILVSGYDSYKLTAREGTGDSVVRQGNVEVLLHPTKHGAPVNMTKQITRGKIGGALHIRDNVIENLLQKNDKLAFTIANEVNKAHIQGVDRYSKSGILFFDLMPEQQDAAAKIRVNETVQIDPGRISAGYQPGSPGDNRVAHRIAAIQYSELFEGGANIDEYYNSMVGEVAVETKQANMRHEHHDKIVQQLGNIRESISGVSLDEETTKMIELQKAFDASARVIRTADELLDTVLNIKRY
tara:strand:- start:3417 stop:4799 length:1383 start_codon:yes stop_codon:yes gene_type:complete